MSDTIIEEVRRVRAEIAARNGNDLGRIFEDARQREGSDGRQIVSYEPADLVSPSAVVSEESPRDGLKRD